MAQDAAVESYGMGGLEKGSAERYEIEWELTIV